MIVAESKARKLFREMGLPHSPKEVSLDKVNQRANNVRTYLSRAEAPATDPSVKLLADILTAVDCEGGVEVVPDDEYDQAVLAESHAKAHAAQDAPEDAHCVSEGAPETAPDVRGGRVVAPKPDKPAKEAPDAAKRKRGQKVTPSSGRHPGIGKAIIDILSKATKAAPVTKMEIHQQLCGLFPDREPTGMYLTVHSLVPRNINKRGLYKVGFDQRKKHFWLESGPHPEGHSARETRRTVDAAKRPPGRPKGSKNKPKVKAPVKAKAKKGKGEEE